jgi:chromosome condensin MukBEF ATPase and DNA-binding subunit MukB
MTSPCLQKDEIKEIKRQLNSGEQASILHNEKITRMQEDIAEIKKNQEKQNEKLDTIVKTIEDKFSSLDDKFAKKTSVDRLWVIVWSII